MRNIWKKLFGKPCEYPPGSAQPSSLREYPPGSAQPSSLREYPPKLGLNRAGNPIGFMALFAFVGLAFAQATTGPVSGPVSGYDTLLGGAVVGGALVSLLPFATVALTQFLKETFKLSGNVVRVINGLVNAAFTGFTSWVLANYTGGWEAAGLWVIGSVLAYMIDQGWIKRINQDNQARAALVGQAVKGGP